MHHEMFEASPTPSPLEPVPQEIVPSAVMAVSALSELISETSHKSE